MVFHRILRESVSVWSFESCRRSNQVVVARVRRELPGLLSSSSKPRLECIMQFLLVGKRMLERGWEIHRAESDASSRK